MYLKFYQNERKIFSPYFDMEINEQAATIVINKLKKHFNFNVFKVSFTAYKNGTAYPRQSSISLPPNMGLGFILHELAHLYNYQKYNNCHHNKKLMKTISRFFKYCIKLNFWGLVQLPIKPDCYGKDADICFILCLYHFDCEKLCSVKPKETIKSPNKVILGKWLYYRRNGGELSFSDYKNNIKGMV